VHAASESAHLESFRHCLRIPRCERLSGRITPFHNFVAQSWGSTVPQNVLTWIISNHPISLRNLLELKIGGGLRVLRDKLCSESGLQTKYSLKIHACPWGGYGSIPINTIFRGMNIHKSQLFSCELQGYYWFWHAARYLFFSVECVPCCFRSATRFSLRSATLRVRLSFAPATIISDNLLENHPKVFRWCKNFETKF